MFVGIYFWTYRTFPNFLLFKPTYFILNNTKTTQVNWFQARRVTNLEQLLSQLFDSIVSYIKKMIRSVNYSNYTQDANPEQTDILFVSSINFFSFFKCPILLILVILLSAIMITNPLQLPYFAILFAILFANLIYILNFNSKIQWIKIVDRYKLLRFWSRKGYIL